MEIEQLRCQELASGSKRSHLGLWDLPINATYEIQLQLFVTMQKKLSWTMSIYKGVHSEGSEAVSGGRGLKIAEIPRQQEVLIQVEETHPKLICLRRASHKQEIQGY